MPDPNALTDTAKVEIPAGGSDSLKAFRASLAAEAGASASQLAGLEVVARKAETHAPLKVGSEARTAERKVVNGRARMILPDGSVVHGKMMDISKSGASVLMDDMLAVKKTCTLECDIFFSGKRQVFSVPAVSVYSVLVSGKGFKAGFQFGSRSPAVSKTIDDFFT